MTNVALINYFNNPGFDTAALEAAILARVGATLAAIDAVDPDTDQVIYFTEEGEADSFTVSAYLRGVLNATSEEAFLAAIGAANTALGALAATALQVRGYVLPADYGVDSAAIQAASTAALSPTFASCGRLSFTNKDGISLDHSVTIPNAQIWDGYDAGNGLGITYEAETGVCITMIGSGAAFRGLNIKQAGAPTSTVGVQIGNGEQGVAPVLKDTVLQGFSTNIELKSNILTKLHNVNSIDAVDYHIAIENEANPASGDWTMAGVTFSSSAARFVGDIAGSTLNVSSMTAGQIVVGQWISGAGLAADTKIVGFGTGTGDVGTYIVDTPQTVASIDIAAGAKAGILYNNSAGGKIIGMKGLGSQIGLHLSIPDVLGAQGGGTAQSLQVAGSSFENQSIANMKFERDPGSVDAGFGLIGIVGNEFAGSPIGLWFGPGVVNSLVEGNVFGSSCDEPIKIDPGANNIVVGHNAFQGAEHVRDERNSFDETGYLNRSDTYAINCASTSVWTAAFEVAVSANRSGLVEISLEGIVQNVGSFAVFRKFMIRNTGSALSLTVIESADDGAVIGFQIAVLGDTAIVQYRLISGTQLQGTATIIPMGKFRRVARG